MFFDLVKHDQHFLHLVFLCFAIALGLNQWMGACVMDKDCDQVAYSKAYISFITLGVIFVFLYVFSFFLEKRFFDKLF